MEYIDSPAESIPLPDAQCDVVCSFNSLDHVQNVAKTISEIKRITRPGGLFLLLLEVNHPPQTCEPHQLSPRKTIDLLKPEFVCESLEVYQPVTNGMYASIMSNVKFPNPEVTGEIGYMSARFRRA